MNKKTRILLSVTAVCAVVIATLGLWLLLRGSSSEVTFFIISDTHYGVSDTVAQANRQTILAMTVLPGNPYPPDIGEGWISPPRGVVVLGDLVEDGGGVSGEDQWRSFAADFGVNGEGLLRHPVYEGFGNHDGGAEHPVRSGIRERNLRRPGVTNISSDGHHYSWDWEQVHFVQLNLFPGSQGEDIINPWGKTFEGSWKYPLHSLEFLERDLADRVGESGRPVVLFQHYGWDEWGLGWWGEGERDRFHAVIKDYRIAAIFWGHSHQAQYIPWLGIPTFCVGSSQHDPSPGVFMVVRITGDEILVAEKTPQGWGLTKKIPLSATGE
jgi:cytolysin (calcineurin-like family phosphatase)